MGYSTFAPPPGLVMMLGRPATGSSCSGPLMRTPRLCRFGLSSTGRMNYAGSSQPRSPVNDEKALAHRFGRMETLRPKLRERVDIFRLSTCSKARVHRQCLSRFATDLVNRAQQPTAFALI